MFVHESELEAYVGRPCFKCEKKWTKKMVGEGDREGMPPDEAAMQARKIRLMKAAILVGLFAIAYFAWRIEAIVALLTPHVAP